MHRSKSAVVARIAGLSALALSAFCLPAEAQEWPKRQITITVVTAAGGSPDTVGRLIASKLTERLGKPVVVENNTAGAGVTGTLNVVRGPADGHNLVVLTGGAPSQELLRPDQPYKLLKDLSMVTTLCAYPLVVAVAPSSPVQNFADLLALAKKQPGGVKFNMNAVGSLHHLLGEWIGIEGKVDVQSIAYRGAPPAFMDVTNGRLDAMIDTTTFIMPQVEQKQLRPLAISSPGPYALAPGVPPIKDTLPAIEMMSWLGLAMAKDTPPAIVEKINAEVRAILEMDDVKKKLAQMGNLPLPSTAQEMSARIERELAQWKRVIDIKGIKAE